MNMFAASLFPLTAHKFPVRTTLTALKGATLLLMLGASVLGIGQEAKTADGETAAPVKVTRVFRPAGSLPESTILHRQVKQRTPVHTNLTPNNTGSGIQYTCDPNVAAATCTYLNTTVANYYNSTFTNANANIYVMYGTTGLGQSSYYLNFITYNQYVTALNNISSKSATQTAAISALNTYDQTPYGSGQVEITAALGSTLGFSPMYGSTVGGAPCEIGANGCYNGIVTVIDDPQDYGFSLYYDNLGGTQPANSYDFYAVVEHETDELLGTASCISTQGNPLSDGCGTGIPSVVDLFRYSAPGTLASISSPSTAPGQYFSYDGGTDYGAYGDGSQPKVYNTLDNGDDYADYISSTPDCGTNQAIQDAEGCAGEDGGLTILNDGKSEITILNALGFSMPSAGTVSLSATNLSFGSLNVGSTGNSQYVTLTNTGSSAVSIGSITLTGANASSWVFANNCGTSLAASANCSIHGHFAPTQAGSLRAAVTITDSAANSPQTISLSGTGVAVQVGLTSTSLSFGTVTVGSTSASQYVTMTNEGSAPLTITSIAVAGANALSYVFANSCGMSLAAGASCSIHGHFAPTKGGALNATLVITDTAGTSPQSITLSGTGVEPPVTLSATKIEYSTTKVGTSSGSQTVTMTNTGTAVLTISSITLGGADPGSFVFANSCGSTLAVGANCTIHGHFAPTTTGALTATVTISDSAAGSPQTIALSGTGD